MRVISKSDIASEPKTNESKTSESKASEKT